MIASYPSPQGGEEYALTLDRGRARRVLVLPALFDEHNKLRHFTVEVMRRLDAAGIDTFLPDLPGCNESQAPLEAQSLAHWRDAVAVAVGHFAVSHVLSIRGGALCEPSGRAVLRYAPATGSSVLRAMLRARIIASKEAGVAETTEALMSRGRTDGLELGGYRLCATMIADLETAEPSGGAALINIAQAELGGPALWLRAEPDHSPEQADALAALIVSHLG